MTPLVSVLIPACNIARFLPEALDSVLAQTYRPFEVVIVDDGSTDDTAAIAASYAARDSRVRVVRQANRGIGAARDRGLAEARGELIALIDGDDLWRPEKLARQVEAMMAGGPSVALVYTWFTVIDEVGREIGPGLPAHWAGDVYPALLLSNFLGSGSTPLMRREAIVDAGGFDSWPLAEDLRLYLAVAYRWRVAVVPEFLVGYRHHARGSSQDIIGMWRSYEQVLAEAADRLPAAAAKLAAIGAANACLWLARRGLHSGRRWSAARLFAEAFKRSPTACFGPPLAVPLRRRLRRLTSSAPAPSAARHFLANPGPPSECDLADHLWTERWQQRMIARYWPERRLLPCEERQ